MSEPTPSRPDRVVAGLAAGSIGPRCLVTGARGFIGSRLVRALQAIGATVVAVDSDRIPRDEVEGVQHKKVDLTLRQRVDDLLAFQPVDVVFHCALTLAGDSVAASEVDAVAHQNTVGTATLLAAARAASVERLVVMGDVQAGLPRARKEGALARSLRYVDAAALQADRAGRLRTVVVRTGTVWGSFGDYVEWVLAGLIRGDRRSVLAVPAHRVHVDNMVRGLLLAAAGLHDDPAEVAGRAFSVLDADDVADEAWLQPMVSSLGYDGGSAAGARRAGPAGGRGVGRVELLSTRRALGWAPVVSYETGMAELVSGVHTLHTGVAARTAAPSLPFRAPDAALADPDETHLSFVVRERRRHSRKERETRLVDGAGRAIEQALSPRSLRVFVDGPHSRVAAPSPFPLGARPIAGLVSLRTRRPDAAAVVARILSEHGFDCAGYKVEESLFADHGDTAHGGPRDWSDGTRSPGVVMVGLAEKRPILAYDDWLSGWLGDVARVTAEVLPRTRYARQRVLEPVTAGAPPVAGIALESFPDIDNTRSLKRMYQAPSLVRLVQNMVRVLWSARRVFRLTRLQAAYLSETVLISAPAPSVGGGAADDPVAPGVEERL